MYHKRRKFSSWRQYEPVYKFRGTIPWKMGERNLNQIVSAILNSFQRTYDISWPEGTAIQGNNLCIDLEMKCRGEIDSIAERSLWALHLKYYDGENAGRWFYHDISVAGNTDNFDFGYNVYTETKNTRPQFSPKLIWALAEECDLTQQVKLDSGVLVFNSAMQIQTLLDLLCDPFRTLPVVIISEINVRDTGKNTRYIVDAVNVAFRLKGYAYVVQLSYEASREFTMQLGRSWSVYDGSVRIFYPEFDPEQDLASDHPGFFKEQINDYVYLDKQGPDAFGIFLLHLMKNAVADLSVDWDGLYFIKELKRLKKELDFFFQWIDGHTARRTEELQTKNLEMAAQLELAREKIQNLQLSLPQHDEDDRSDKMEPTLSPANSSDWRNDKDAIPETYSEIPAWAKERFQGKLVLHPRAERAVEKGKYFSIEIVCEALRLLAHEYRNSRLGIESDMAFKEGCQKYKLAFCGTLKCPKKKEAQEAYFVNYPDGDKRCQLSSKLQRGNSRNRRYCLRIYFFWDEGNQLVVVGYMPDHLPNLSS